MNLPAAPSVGLANMWAFHNLTGRIHRRDEVKRIHRLERRLARRETRRLLEECLEGALQDAAEREAAIAADAQRYAEREAREEAAEERRLWGDNTAEMQAESFFLRFQDTRIP